MHPHWPHLYRSAHRINRVMKVLPSREQSTHAVPVADLIPVFKQQFAPLRFKGPAPAAKRISVVRNVHTVRFCISVWLIIFCSGLALTWCHLMFFASN